MSNFANAGGDLPGNHGMPAFLRRWLSAHKGHNQLGVRSAINICHAILSFAVMLGRDPIPQDVMTMMAQVCSATTLFVQWRSGDPRMFVARGIVSWVRAIFILHWSTCGRNAPWPSAECDIEGWVDLRWPFRVLLVYAAIRQIFNGTSLFLQFAFPNRGVTATCGNEQLWYRSKIQLTGIPMQFLQGLLKEYILGDTIHKRPLIEAVVNFLRCFLIVGSATSLKVQWRSTGTGLPMPANTVPVTSG